MILVNNSKPHADMCMKIGICIGLNSRTLNSHKVNKCYSKQMSYAQKFFGALFTTKGNTFKLRFFQK